MACTPQVQFADPPAGSCISPDLVEYLRTSVSIENPCTLGGAGIFTGTTPPGVDDTDKIWQRTDSAGTPLYFCAYFNGAWRRVGGGPGPQAVMFYKGPIDGVFDVNSGMGLRGGFFDGWIIRYSDANKFIVNASSYNGSNWVSGITGSDLITGGVTTYQSDSTNTYRPARPAAVVAQGYADGNNNTGTPAGIVYTTAGGAPIVTLLASDVGNLTPPSTSIVPPFIAYVQIEYVGIAI
jgi:hypothetical protein